MPLKNEFICLGAAGNFAQDSERSQRAQAVIAACDTGRRSIASAALPQAISVCEWMSGVMDRGGRLQWPPPQAGLRPVFYFYADHLGKAGFGERYAVEDIRALHRDAPVGHDENLTFAGGVSR